MPEIRTTGNLPDLSSEERKFNALLGQRKPLFADWSIPLPPEWRGEGGVTLRDIITRIVREQVQAFRRRQEDRQGLKVLTSRQIADAAETGRITLGESEVGLQPVNEEAAIGSALQAFEDGLFLVVIDEVEYKELDRQVPILEDSRITFLRLTLLAGG
ncbi:hypothetical protein SH661x_002853 [Planctomicrobium sp. SH661]|uniref:hypothetical protein n=1 Tax=Planctomicrobium sp. SH661 TaxID=3448124 RepID=UPI003F5B70DF